MFKKINYYSVYYTVYYTIQYAILFGLPTIGHHHYTINKKYFDNYFGIKIHDNINKNKQINEREEEN